MPGIGHHRRPHRVKHHITRQLEQVTVFFDQYRFVAPLEHVAGFAVFAVECLGLDPIEMTHSCGKVAFDRFHHKMIMVGHLAPGMANPVKPDARLSQDIEPAQPVAVIEINILAPVATRGDVIEPACQFDS